MICLLKEERITESDNLIPRQYNYEEIEKKKTEKAVLFYRNDVQEISNNLKGWNYVYCMPITHSKQLIFLPFLALFVIECLCKILANFLSEVTSK